MSRSARPAPGCGPRRPPPRPRAAVMSANNASARPPDTQGHLRRRTPMTARLALAITLVTSLGFPLAGCVVLDAPHGYHHDGGPPPHAPAHGYRRNHQG